MGGVELVVCLSQSLRDGGKGGRGGGGVHAPWMGSKGERKLKHWMDRQQEKEADVGQQEHVFQALGDDTKHVFWVWENGLGAEASNSRRGGK